ncbi:CheY-like chemotaxis protein [Hydrogenophaga palleronii]|uniref:CheY-like chemotaxis protein n=1 Tax=Hydrogenophaga palleronii TaxID=65655 RepID=A0ABU1WKZ1_9BURK|nr:CheY-like chemotaxis protein [Hydrogenophaga palleronii]
MTHQFMLKGARILLVDDAAICRQVVLELLSGEGIDVQARPPTFQRSNPAGS